MVQKWFARGANSSLDFPKSLIPCSISLVGVSYNSLVPLAEQKKSALLMRSCQRVCSRRIDRFWPEKIKQKHCYRMIKILTMVRISASPRISNSAYFSRTTAWTPFFLPICSPCVHAVVWISLVFKFQRILLFVSLRWHFTQFPGSSS